MWPFAKTFIGAAIVPLLVDLPVGEYPTAVNNEAEIPRVLNQRDSAMCVAVSVAQWISIRDAKHGKKDSAYNTECLASGIYWRATERQGRRFWQGCSIEHAIGAAMELGLIKESSKCYRVRNATEMRSAIFRFGHVLSVFRICDDWKPFTEGARLIKHCVLTSKYAVSGFSGPNSWGDAWGVDGFWSRSNEDFEREFVEGVAICEGE